MKTRTKWLVGLLSLCCASIIGVGATSQIVKAEDVAVDSSSEEVVTIPTIIDTCDQAGGAGAPTADLYSLKVGTDNFGFNSGGMYSTTQAPTAAPTASTWWESYYGYAVYNLSGQNVIKVEAVVAPEAIDLLGPVCCYVNGILDVYDMSSEVAPSTGWAKITYTYVIPADKIASAKTLRVIPSVYNDESTGLQTWMQQITKVEISYMETLPENPAVLYKKVGTDNCTNNVTAGIRKDVYNVRILSDNVAQIGDMYRMAYGNHGDESYVEYNMNNMDTLVVTAYEPIGENNTRPNATQVRFAVWQNGNCVKWAVEATSTEVVLGDYASGRWTKVVYTYQFDKTYESAVVRLMMYKPTAEQAELQIGRVDVYNSKYADLSGMAAKAELEAYAWAKDYASYTAENWANLVAIMVDAKLSLDGVDTAQAIASIVTKAKADMDAVETIPVIPEDSSSEVVDPEDSSSEVVEPEDSSSEEEIVEIPTIVDDCEYVEGANRVADDVYGYNVTKADIGFGEDSRFSNRLNPTSAPKVWDGAYAQYNLAGQNVIIVVAAEAPEAKGKLNPVFIYTDKATVLEVYDIKTETAASTGWSYVTYTYVLEGDLLANTSNIRLVTSAYKDEANGLEAWMQSIAKVEISYMETLPEKTPEIPEDSSSSEDIVDSSSSEEPDIPVVVDPIIDNCDKDQNSVFADLYGYKLDGGDVGFGEDSRYLLMRAPTEPISKDKIWDANYAYVQYTVSGHNLLTVVADIPADVLAKMPHIFVFGCKGNTFPVLELNNYSVETSSNWSRVTYTYIVPEGFNWVRVMAGAYNAWDESVSVWQQQITLIKLEKVDVLPEKDADIPEIQLPPEKPAPEAPDLTIVQSDNCTSIKIEGARKDIYNVSVLSDNMEATADASRMVFGSNAGAQESYIDYNMNYMDTIAVTTFEPILADGSRPENTTKIRFSIWLNGKVSKWEVDATSTEVVLGDAISGRWTKVVWYYKLESAIENASIRVMIYKPTEGQVEVQIGRVDIYNSQYANFFRMEAQAEIEEYAYQQNKQDYSESNWLNVLSAMIVAKEAIDSAADESEANAIVVAAKAEIDAVKTFADEFEDRKEDKKMELSDFAVNKGKKNYTSEAWDLIVGYVVAAQAKIDEATTEDEVRAIMNETKELINAVEQLKPEPPVEDSSSEDEEEDEEDNNPAGGLDLSSCFSGIESAGMMLVVLAGSVVAMLGKKKEDNE